MNMKLRRQLVVLIEDPLMQTLVQYIVGLLMWFRQLIYFYFFPYAFYQYMLEPLPVRISNIFDLVLFFENLIRALFLLKGLKYLIKNYFFKPQTVMIMYFLIIELIWSVGTTNWGTAVRHHIPSIGILSLLAFMFPNDFYKKGVN